MEFNPDTSEVTKLDGKWGVIQRVRRERIDYIFRSGPDLKHHPSFYSRDAGLPAELLHHFVLIFGITQHQQYFCFHIGGDAVLVREVIVFFNFNFYFNMFYLFSIYFL